MHVAAFRFILDRYRFGLSGPRLGVVWSPPLGAVALTTAYVVLIVLLCSWWWRASRPQKATGLAGAALRLGVSAVVAGGALALGGTTAVAATTTVSTWSGGVGSGGSGNWSDAANWSTSEPPSGSVTTSDLVFPPLAACDERPGASCVVHDDLNTTAAHNVTIQSGPTGAYTFTSGSGSLTLGSGGLNIAAAGDRSRATVGIPIVLGADQVWNMSGGVSAFDGSIGGSKALTLNLSAGASLDLKDNLDVGDLSVIDVSGSGPRARVVLNGGDLNGGSGSPMDVDGIALGGYGHLGPLAASSTSLTVGRGYTGPKHGTGALTSSADLSLDSSSGVTFDDLAYPGTPGDGYPQLAVEGVVTLGSASLRLDTTCRPSVGDAFPIVTGRSISGTFTAGGKPIANGDVIRATAVGARCADDFKILYSANTVTAVDAPDPEAIALAVVMGVEAGPGALDVFSDSADPLGLGWAVGRRRGQGHPRCRRPTHGHGRGRLPPGLLGGDLLGGPGGDEPFGATGELVDVAQPSQRHPDVGVEDEVGGDIGGEHTRSQGAGNGLAEGHAHVDDERHRPEEQDVPDDPRPGRHVVVKPAVDGERDAQDADPGQDRSPSPQPEDADAPPPRDLGVLEDGPEMPTTDLEPSLCPPQALVAQ